MAKNGKTVVVVPVVKPVANGKPRVRVKTVKPTVVKHFADETNRTKYGLALENKGQTITGPITVVPGDKLTFVDDKGRSYGIRVGDDFDYAGTNRGTGSAQLNAIIGRAGTVGIALEDAVKMLEDMGSKRTEIAGQIKYLKNREIITVTGGVAKLTAAGTARLKKIGAVDIPAPKKGKNGKK